MLIVLDDVLGEERRQAVVGFFAKDADARSAKWQACVKSGIQNDNSPMALLLKEAGKYFDLSNMLGSEYWAQYGTRPDWHVDKDEKLYAMSGNTEFPICSIVYYADVDVIGGNFMTETVTVKPITNRMVIFAPGLIHGVEPYTGTRLAVAVNPWAHKPIGYA